MADATIQQSGGDFSSLNAFIADAGTSASDTGTIQGTWSVDDTTAVTWNKAVIIEADADSKQAGRPWDTGDTTYRHRVTSGHAITVSAAVDISDINIQSSSGGTSDELFRMSSPQNLTCRRCMLGWDNDINQQDVVYLDDASSSVTFLFEQCFFYEVGRSIVDAYTGTAETGTITIDFNSCGSYAVGGFGGRENAAWVGIGSSSNDADYNVNAHNCLLTSDDTNVFAIRAAIDATLDVSATYCLTDVTAANLSANEDSETTTGSGFSYTWTDGTPGAGSVVALTDITTIPYDPTLQDDANNDAQEFHSVATGSGLTIPATDYIGNTRDAAYDVGPHEVSFPSGQTITVGLATESDSAFAAGVARTLAAGLATETDTGLAATVARTLAAGQALETDSAFPAGVARTLAAGLATETDTALAAAVARALGVGQALETDSAFAVTFARALAIGQALETDSALPAIVSGALAIGQALETDSALAASSAKLAAVGLATETDTALAAGAGKARALGQALETDSALPVALPAGIGLATETDTALAANSAKLRAVGLATETNTGFGATPFQAFPIGQAIETDSAFAATWSKAAEVGQALETDSSLAATGAKLAAAGLALETDSAFGVTFFKATTIGLALEIDSAFFVAASGGVTAPNVAGLSWSAPAARVHLSAPTDRLHYTAPS